MLRLWLFGLCILSLMVSKHLCGSCFSLALFYGHTIDMKDTHKITALTEGTLSDDATGTSCSCISAP